MSMFDNRYGVAFNYGTNGHNIVRGNHSFHNYGLYPVEIRIEPPDVNTSGLYIPGMDGKLDTTDTLDGVVHFKNRKAEFKFKQINAKTKWIDTYHLLMRDLHGQKRKILLDEDDIGYYEGRFTVEKPSIKKTGAQVVAYFTIKGDLKPYQYDHFSTGQDWLWAPFRFTPDSIRRAYGAIHVLGTGTTTQEIITSEMPVTPNIYIKEASTGVTGVSVTYQGVTKTINVGSDDNRAMFSDFVLCSLRQTSQTITLSLVGTSLTSDSTATVSIDYPTGRL